MVLESCERVMELAAAYRARVLGAAWPDAASTLGALMSYSVLTAVAKDED